MMTPQAFQDLLDRYTRGECTRAEENIVHEWYNEIGKDQPQHISEEFRVVIEAKLWSRLQEQLKLKQADAFHGWRKTAAVLAFILLAGVAGFAVYRHMSLADSPLVNSTISEDDKLITVVNKGGEIKMIVLHDGSQVILQPQSEIRYEKVFGLNREVYLTGEAFFDVKRDEKHPFLVYSGDVVTRVLGTSFNVKAYDRSKQVTVAVKTGRVSVYKNTLDTAADKPSEKEVILAPNQQAVFDLQSQQLSKQLVEKPAIVLAKPTLIEMKYDGEPVMKILNVLAENYGVQIDFDEEKLSNCTLTTSLREEGLFERINIICEAIGARYTIEGTTIRIVSEHGCQ